MDSRLADTPPRLQLLAEIERAVALSNQDASVDAHQLLGRVIAPHLNLLRDLLFTGVHGEPITFENCHTPGEAVRFTLRLSHLKADGWRLEWQDGATGEPQSVLHTALLDALIAAEDLAKSTPSTPSTLTPLFADRTNTLVSEMLAAARLATGLLPPGEDDTPDTALERLRRVAQAYAPLAIINPVAPRPEVL